MVGFYENVRNLCDREWSFFYQMREGWYKFLYKKKEGQRLNKLGEDAGINVKEKKKERKKTEPMTCILVG